MIKRFALAAALGFAAVALAAGSGSAAGKPTGGSSFSNTRLLVPLTDTFPGVTAKTTGDSEPSISIGNDGHMAVGGLAWIPFQVNLWSGQAGSTPSFFGAMDKQIPENGARTGLGDGDEDIDVASTGTTHLADLDFVVNPTFNSSQLGVSVTNCPRSATGPSDCKTQVLDTTGADRQWITSNGENVWVSYHDSTNSTLIRTKISHDDGNTWSAGGSPVVGQGSLTGDSTFNNEQGPIVADPQDPSRVFDVFASGTPQSKCCSADFNQMNVSRSTDGGKTYAAQTIFAAPAGFALDNIFPWLAVDPVTDYVYVAWSDGHGVWLSESKQHGDPGTFSMAKKVSSATTAIFPAVAAYDGKVDVVFYGTSGSSNMDPSAVWNTYDSQSLDNGATFTQLQVSKRPNHFGVVCEGGITCDLDTTRTLLDLFEVAENPLTGKASIIYTDDTFDTWIDDGTTLRLPEIVLAQEN